MNKKIIFNLTIFFTLLLGMSLFPYIPITIFNIDLSVLPDYGKILYELSCDIAYMLIIYSIYYKDINRDLKAYFSNFKSNFKLSFNYYIIGYFIMVISNILISLLFRNAIAGNEETVRSLIDKYPLYMLFSVSIYAPFVEEIIFRKTLHDVVYSFKNTKYTKYIYIILSGFIFSSMHVLGSATNTIDYLYIIPYLGIGISFAYLYDKTNNIFSTITMHSLHNTIAIITYLGGLKWRNSLNG